MSFVGRGGGIRGTEVCQTPKNGAAPPVSRGTHHSCGSMLRQPCDPRQELSLGFIRSQTAARAKP